jgi:predicted N-acetyltransferase YhbS
VIAQDCSGSGVDNSSQYFAKPAIMSGLAEFGAALEGDVTDALTKSDCRLRPMTEDDLQAVHGLSRRVQWPHRPEEWLFNLKLGRGVVAEREGSTVGTVMWWPYGPDAASVGMVIVDPAHQAEGIGRALMTAALGALDGRAVMVNATADGLKLYRALGFQPIDAIQQHQGAAFAVPVAPLGPGERIRPIGRGDGADLAALDRAATGLKRDRLVAALLDEAEGVVLDRDGEAIGFALYRRFGQGHLIGPVIAPTQEGAKALISHWMASNPGIFIRVDVLGDSLLSPWLDKLGLAGVGPVTTMVRGTKPHRAETGRYWAVASQAFG